MMESPLPAPQADKARLAYLRAAAQGELGAMLELEPLVPVNVVGLRHQRSAMHMAAFYGHLHVIEHLIGRGHDTSQRDMRGWTPAACAVFNKHFSCWRRLMHEVASTAGRQSGVVHDLVDAQGVTYAAYDGPSPDPRLCSETVQVAFASNELMSMRWMGKESAACLYDAAAQSRSIEALELLQDMGWQVRDANRENNRLLEMTEPQSPEDAVYREVALLLVERGAAVRFSSHKGMVAPVAAMARRNDVELLQACFKQLAEERREGFFTLITKEAVEWAAEDVVRWVHGCGVDLSSIRVNDEVSLPQLAVQWHHPSTLRLLLDLGCDKDLESRFGHTPLHSACASGKTDMLRILLEHGADMYAGARRKQGFPAHVAIAKDKPECLAALLSAGFDADRAARTQESVREKCRRLGGSWQDLMLAHDARNAARATLHTLDLA